MRDFVLFVCTGNVCRSPMAAALYQRRLAQAGDADSCTVASAGTWAMEGEPASPSAQLVMARRGLTLEGHRAQSVTGELVERASLVIVMAQGHASALAAEFPAAGTKIHMMSELAGLRYDIADPMGRSIEEYEACALELDQLIERGYPLLAGWLAETNSTNQPLF